MAWHGMGLEDGLMLMCNAFLFVSFARQRWRLGGSGDGGGTCDPTDLSALTCTYLFESCLASVLAIVSSSFAT